jgi:hypothetical protein
LLLAAPPGAFRIEMQRPNHCGGKDSDTETARRTARESADTFSTWFGMPILEHMSVANTLGKKRKVSQRS